MNIYEAYGIDHLHLITKFFKDTVIDGWLFPQIEMQTKRAKKGNPLLASLAKR